MALEKAKSVSSPISQQHRYPTWCSQHLERMSKFQFVSFGLVMVLRGTEEVTLALSIPNLSPWE